MKSKNIMNRRGIEELKRIVAITMIVLICMSSPSLLLPQLGHAATTGLVGYWNFDESSGTVAHDSSGNGNTGTTVGDPQWVTGVSGSALNFDGTTHVSIQSSPSLTLKSNSMSIELWIKPSVTLDGSTPSTNIVDYGNEYGIQMNHDFTGSTPDGTIWFYVATHPFPPASMGDRYKQRPINGLQTHGITLLAPTMDP